MKTIVIGILAFIVWSSISTYRYLHKIKDFEDGTTTADVTEISAEGAPISAPEEAEKPTEASFKNPGSFTLNHDFDKSVFIEKPTLSAFVGQLQKFLDQNDGSQIHIYGYTDNLGTTTYNQRLALKRARTVRDFLTELGIPGARMHVHAIGEDDPIADNSTDEGRALNRRTTIEIN